MDAPVSKHSNAWRFLTRFTGKLPPKEYLSPDIRLSNPGWGDEMFNRPIESIQFHLPTGHRLVLAGMEQYNFFIEASEAFSRGGAKVEAFWFLGKPPASDLVEAWRIGNGRIIRDRKLWGREWGGTPTRGWKAGAISGTVISAIMEG